MLLIAARLGGMRMRPARMLLGALIGALCARLIQRLALPRGAAAVLWLPTAFVMQAAAHGRRAFAHPVRQICLLLCAAGLLGGTLTALYGATGSLYASYALCAGCMAAMTASLMRAKRAAADVHRVVILTRYRGRMARFEAMIDSGNTLRDYLTHYPVIVMPAALGRRLFKLKGEALRPIFADTAGGRQMMALFVPGETIVLLGGQRLKVDAAVALCSGLSEHVPALAPASLMDGLLSIRSIGG